MKFSELNVLWKVFIIIGIIASILVVGLTTLVIIIFKTDLISLEDILGSREQEEDIDIGEFEDFLQDMIEEETEEETEEEEMDKLFLKENEIMDMDGNIVSKDELYCKILCV